MATRLAAIFELGANTARFDAGFKRARDSLNKFERSFDRSMKKVGRAAATTAKSIAALGAASVAAATAASVLTQRIVDQADQVAKAARTVDLTVSSYQSLVFAFDRLGVAADTTRQGFGDFLRRLGQARSEAGSLRDTFVRAGVDITGTTEGSLRSAIAVLEQMESASERAALAGRLFGEEAGFKLAAAIGTGSGAVAQLEAEFREIGGLTDISARNAEHLKDVLTNLSTELKNNINNAVLQNAELIERIARGAFSAANAVVNLGAKLASAFGNFTGFSDKQLEAERADALRKFNAFRKERFVGPRNEDPDLIASIEQQRERLKGIEAEIERRKQLREVIKLETEARDVAIGIRSASAVSFEKYSEALGKSTDALFDETQAASQWGRIWQDVTEARERSIARFSRDLVHAVKAADSFGDAIKNMGQRLVDLVQNKLIWRPLERRIGNLLDSMTGGGNGIFSTIGNVLFRERGGFTPSNRPVLVGEKGPELISLNKPAYVTPNNQLGGGNMTVNNTINAPGASKAELMAVRQELDYLRDNFRTLVSGTVDAQFFDGGLLRS